MKYDFIDTALRHGGFLAMADQQGLLTATMIWKEKGHVVEGAPATTIPHALNSLNHALQDDAVDEVFRLGKA